MPFGFMILVISELLSSQSTWCPSNDVHANPEITELRFWVECIAHFPLVKYKIK